MLACGDDTEVKKDGKIKLDGPVTTPDSGPDGIQLTEGGPGLETGPGLEGGTVEGGVPPNCTATVGKSCTKDADCGNGACLAVSKTVGICTCKCTPDDSKTPLIDEDNCPGKPANVCGEVKLDGGKTANYCLKKCTPKLNANDCATGVACNPMSDYYGGVFGFAVCLLTGCASDADCYLSTGPACDTTKSTCAAGEQCLASSSGSTKGLCYKNGKCDKVSGLCKGWTGKAGVKVGATCKGDIDCGPNQDCMREADEIKDYGMKKTGAACTQDSDCCSYDCTTAGTCGKGICKIRYRNGYCVKRGCVHSKTLTKQACDTGSVCNIMYYGGGLCMKSCTLANAKSCRNNTGDYYGDYECRQWNNLQIGGTAVTSGPVCDFGGMECDTFGTSSTLSCASVGDASNSTKMQCTDPYTGKAKATKTDPTGWCLDNTSCGTKKRTP